MKPRAKKIDHDRGKTYGDFEHQASTAQLLKFAMENNPGWKNLPDTTKEALQMIQTKVSRIINGDAYYVDNYSDIAGYANLPPRFFS